MPSVQTGDGVRLHVAERGSGRPLVLLHGWTFSGRFSDRNVPAPAGSARVVTVDLRGHGDSAEPEHGYRPARTGSSCGRSCGPSRPGPSASCSSPRWRSVLAEMATCPPPVRNAVMADHTRHDWRDLPPTLTLPTPVCVARQDAVCDRRGPAWVGEHVPGARTESFEEGSHALVLDEPDHVNRVVAGIHADAQVPR